VVTVTEAEAVVADTWSGVLTQESGLSEDKIDRSMRRLYKTKIDAMSYPDLKQSLSPKVQARLDAR
jgi:hypothetical protein